MSLTEPDEPMLPSIDLSRLRRSVGRRVKRERHQPVGRGTVTAVDWPSFTLTATVKGAPMDGIKFLYPYVPSTGDEVFVLKNGKGDRVAFGAMERRLQAVFVDPEGAWRTTTSFGSADAVWLIGGTLVQDVDVNGNLLVALGLSVSGIWTAWAVGGDASAIDPLNCNLFDPQVNSFRVSLSNHTGVFADLGLVRIQWGALCWI